MADNVGYTPGTGSKVATRDVTYSGESANAQAVGLVTFAGSDDAKTATDVSTTNPLPVSAATLPLPTGAATAALQPDVITKNPMFEDRGAVVRQAPANIWSAGFSEVGSSLLASELTQRRLGTGMGVTQGSGNLLVTTGTTTNSEFLARSLTSFRGAFTARHKTILSQRIANNNFAVMMADMVGEGLSCTINSATSITVTKTAHGLTSANVGQFMMVGAINGAAGVPGRYAIASVPTADTITFTVAGWPASGSCTVDLFGWNYVWTQYTGTTATSANIDAQRRGWNSGVTAATINTTASAGHVMNTYADGRNINWSDTLVASATTPTVTTRASRIENLPDDDVELYVYLWAWNGTTAPASTTTWTLGFLAVEDCANVPSYIAGIRPLGSAAPLPVSGAFFQATQPVSLATNTPTLAAGTNLAGDVGVQYRANATGAATLANVNCPATPAAQQLKTGAGRLVGVAVTNTAASARWIKIFNLAGASVTPGTTSATAEIGLSAGQTLEWSLDGGAAFSTGITIMVTGGQGLTNNTAVTAGDVTGMAFFA
jgi:hypothetical protein